MPDRGLDILRYDADVFQIKNLEPRQHHVLTPEKLAAFYRSVGGNFDSLFLETSPASLSFVYQALGCYHSLQPVADPFKPPAIPALTASGFKRWATIQLLLQPAEQVPLLQAAVRIYDINNRADGHVFPKILPAECFPRRPDPGMVQWHDDSLQKLKLEAEQEAAAANAAPRPAMARGSSGTPMDDSSGEDGGKDGYFSIARWKGKVASRWDQFRGDGGPLSPREGRSPRERERERERRRRGYDDGTNGGYRYHKRPSIDTGRRSSHPGHRVDSDYGRGGRARTYTQADYDSPPSPGDTSYEARTRARPQYEARNSPLSPGTAGWDRERDQERGYTSAGPSPRSATPPSARPPPVTRTRPSSDKYGRRHSSHEPLSPRAEDDEPEYTRARSRSHHGRSPNERLSPSDAYNGQTTRPINSYGPADATASSGVSTTAPPAFARGNLRHTVHSSGQSPYRGKPVDDGDEPRMKPGVRYIPAADKPRRVDRSRDYVGN